MCLTPVTDQCEKRKEEKVQRGLSSQTILVELVVLFHFCSIQPLKIVPAID